MAGIGFELKKLFRRGGLFSTVRGVAYASAVTVGPMVSIIAVLLALYSLLDYLSLSYAQREMLTGAIMYVFIFSMIVTAPINAVLSRYVADKLFDGRKDDILASFYLGLALNLFLGALLAVPFALSAVLGGHVDAVFALAAYCLFVAIVSTFFCMTYVSALKEYRQIGYAFFFGMATALGVSYGLFRLDVAGTPLAILAGLAAGFTLIALLLTGQIRAFFRQCNPVYREVWGYFRRYGVLLLCNLFYALGLYAHNFVFWGSDLGIVISGTFRVAPVYDAATCYAMFTNISALVLFVVQVETRFHEKYQTFCQAVIGGGSDDIRFAKQEMFRSMAREMNYMLQFQVLITISVYVFCLLVLPMLGVAGLTLAIYPTLAVAYLVIYVLYMLVVFMYYLEDYRGALYSTATFFAATVAASLLAARLLPQEAYGLGVFAGAFAGWTVGYFRLRWLERTFDQHIFCRGHLTLLKDLSN